MATNLGGGIDGCSVFQEESNHVDLPKVTCSVQWSVASLTEKTQEFYQPQR